MSNWEYWLGLMPWLHRELGSQDDLQFYGTQRRRSEVPKAEHGTYS